jgi:RNA polymerase sigma-70 factor (ECF subfamily)
MSNRPEIAEDVTQEAFVRVLRNLDRFDPKYRFSTWLFTIAKRLYVNWAQKFRPISESDIVSAWSSGGPSPDQDMVANETRTQTKAAVRDALASLGEVQRAIVLLFHQQNWAIADISVYLDMPEGTIKSHLHRARRRMKEAIEQDHASVSESAKIQAQGRHRDSFVDDQVDVDRENTVEVAI